MFTGSLDSSWIVELPATVKADTSKTGERIVRVEASNEAKDKEGDIILQSALLHPDTVKDFLEGGDLDIDHLSKIGHRYGIENPDRFVIGVPVRVYDGGKGRTIVEGRIYKSSTFDIKNNLYDWFWNSLTTDPPMKWRASIFGQPIKVKEESGGADRFLISEMNWTSLAFTRHPVNDSIEGYATIVKAEDYAMRIVKSYVRKDMDSLGITASEGGASVDINVGDSGIAASSTDSNFSVFNIPSLEELYCKICAIENLRERMMDNYRALATYPRLVKIKLVAEIIEQFYGFPKDLCETLSFALYEFAKFDSG
jgi:hypothetical protein